MQLKLLSVNIARPKIIATIEGKPVRSAIAKQPVSGSVFVTANGIDGDEVGDPVAHGGPDKAVYAYPAGNWGWWEREIGLACAPATFGENLTLEGADEDDIRIGDRFQWGEAILEVAQPRMPCFKFAIHTAKPEAPQVMMMSGKAGWYFRVLREGHSGPGFARIFASGGPTVREASLARHNPAASPELIALVHAAPGLAENWRNALAKRLPSAL
ncbi:MAG TPA: MOSC domain-containing protein [Rhizomicrobium sp.]|nr:MOSC domain-containing protein [Rhizomicrobium sp.]